MSSNFKISQITAQAQATQGLVGPFLDGSIVKIYDGIQPANPEIPLGSQNLLATIPLPNSDSFSAMNGILTASAINNVVIAHSGVASWFRWYQADGVSVIADGSCGTANADLILSSINLVITSTLGVGPFTLTIPSS